LAILALATGMGSAPHDRLGLFTSLPILWAETGSVAGQLNAEHPPHWARAALADRSRITALDSLVDGAGRSSLKGLPLIVMAQPRPLSPAENVALDDWVRGGGRLLLLADPALTAHSGFGLGDKRRPQAVVLLSPILTRWGLRLEMDDSQPFGERQVDLLGGQTLVNLPGQLALSGGDQTCRILAKGLAARCRIGRGHVLVIADAALLEEGDPMQVEARRAALERLLDALGAA
jgi:hypothetical protein